MWKAFFLVTSFLVVACAADEEPELKERGVKLRTAVCASTMPSDKIDRLFECDQVVALAVSTAP